MKLHISFDMADLDKALKIAKQISGHVTSMNIGSLLLYSHGIKAIETFEETFEDMEIIADSKIVDKAKETTTLLLNAGADWVTVMAGAPKEVIHSVCTTAHDQGKDVMIDLLDSCSLGQSALEAQSMGGDALIFHGAYSNPDDPILIDNWNMVRNNSSLPIYVTATKNTIDHIIKLNPDGIIVGKAITESEDPLASLSELINKISSQT